MRLAAAPHNVSDTRMLTPGLKPGLMKEVLGMLGLACLAVYGRLWGIDRESLWLDEAGRVAIAMLPFDRIAAGVAALELSPPLYHYALAGWIRIFGEGDAAARGLSAFLAAPAVALAWGLGRAVGGSLLAVVLAILVAANPFAVHYGQEAAMYALFLPLSIAAIWAAVEVLEGSCVSRARWLGLYSVCGALALYTHYYAVFMLTTIGLVGVFHSLRVRAWHGVGAWVAAHLVIGLAFLPWLPVAITQVRLASSVDDWSGVAPLAAVRLWATALLADGATNSGADLAVLVAVLGVGIGAWRLRKQPVVAALLVALVLLPLLFAIALSDPANAFRPRGFIGVASALWLLLAVGLVYERRRGWLDAAVRIALATALFGVAAMGHAHHIQERKEDWRGAAAHVAARAGRSEPIFFVHYAGAVAFDHYYQGQQPRIGLPESFRWEDGYQAPYRVTPADVERVVPPALADQQRAWLVLSHDDGRGSDHVVRFLDDWSGGKRSEAALYGVRVLSFTR